MKNENAANDVLIGIAIVAIIIFAVVGSIAMWFSVGVAKVASDELSPTVLQQKYEWFKDASAQLDAKVANIEVYQGRITRMNKMYEGMPRTHWNRADIDQVNLYESEVGGIKASYNSLAATYNAEMVKWNWKFTNIGELPQGATKVLPREYKPYIGE
jgi:hypothetical protein